MLRADFEQHGEEVIRRVRERKPEVYLASIVSLMPRQKEKIESPFIDITDEELAMLEEMLTAGRAKLIEQHNGTAIELEPSNAKQSEKS